MKKPVNGTDDMDDVNKGEGLPDPEQQELALLITADDSISAEAYANLLTENGIHVISKDPKTYLQRFINIGYSRYVSLYVPAGQLEEAQSLLEILASEQQDEILIDQIQAENAASGESGAPCDGGKQLQDTGPGLRGAKSVFGFIFLILILLLPTAVAVYAIIIHIRNL